MTRFDEAVCIAQSVAHRERTQWVGRTPTDIEVLARELLRVAPVVAALAEERARHQDYIDVEAQWARDRPEVQLRLPLLRALDEARRTLDAAIDAYLETDDAR